MLVMLFILLIFVRRHFVYLSKLFRIEPCLKNTNINKAIIADHKICFFMFLYRINRRRSELKIIFIPDILHIYKEFLISPILGYKITPYTLKYKRRLTLLG